MEMTLALAGSRAVRLEPACTRLPKTARPSRGFAETCQNIAEFHPASWEQSFTFLVRTRDLPAVPA